jgi:sigma-B regulation protein RsbU (phosphoserine phosphatase)
MIVGILASMGLLVLNAQKEASVMTSQTIVSIENALQPAELVPQTLVQALENPNTTYDDAMRIARDFVLHDPNVFGTCLAFEPNYFNRDQYWYAIYSYQNGEKLQTKILGSTDYDYFKMDWYRVPKLLRKPVWSEPYFDKGGGNTLMCTYSIPIIKKWNGINSFIGVLTMDISLVGFDRIVKQVSIFDSGYGFLISKKGYIISSPVPQMHNRNVLELAVSGKGSRTKNAMLGMMNGDTGFVSMDGLSSKNNPSYLSYAPVGNTGWSFGIIFLEKELFSDMFTFLKVMAWMWGISIAILLITTVWITRKLTRPIVRLVTAAKKIGQGDFDAPLPVRKSKDEVAQLTTAFGVMQEELRNYIRNLEETTTAKEKIESELKVAQEIQLGMLPRGFKTPENWELFATLDPAKAVGGDLYDFFYLDDQHLCVAIGDVAGKGVPASLFMMVTRTLLRAKATSGQNLASLMTSINEELCKENPNQMFVTFFVGIVDLNSGIMEFCNAGHNYPYIISKCGSVNQLKIRTGLPLGIFADTKYEVSNYRFRPFEIMVMTTDGITDALNNSNDFFGEANLAAFLSTLAQRDTRSITELLIAEVKRFSTGTEQADDITILSLQYKDSSKTNSDYMNRDHLTLINKVDELERIVTKLETLAETWKIPARAVMEINLALEELFTNVVFYAYSDKKIHTIEVDFFLAEPSVVQLRFEDDGEPFNLLEKYASDTTDLPVEERPIGGLGIHLVRQLMTKVEYQRVGEHNVVILTKNFA